MTKPTFTTRRTAILDVIRRHHPEPMQPSAISAAANRAGIDDGKAITALEELGMVERDEASISARICTPIGLAWPTDMLEIPEMRTYAVLVAVAKAGRPVAAGQLTESMGRECHIAMGVTLRAMAKAGLLSACGQRGKKTYAPVAALEDWARAIRSTGKRKPRRVCECRQCGKRFVAAVDRDDRTRETCSQACLSALKSKVGREAYMPRTDKGAIICQTDDEGYLSWRQRAALEELPPAVRARIAAGAVER